MAEIVTPAVRALSALLTYPTGELCAAAGEIAAVLATDEQLPAPARADLVPLLEDLRTQDLYALQERYVELFDRNRRLSLHLFEHVHGESRDRGQAMVDLAALYEQAGLLAAPNELPDYLPLFLEYLATRPVAEARGLIGETAHILSALETRLAGRKSPYAAVFAAIRAFGGAALVAPEQPAAPDPDLDPEWEETQVTFGPGDAVDGCSADRLRMRMRAARRDARGTAA